MGGADYFKANAAWMHTEFRLIGLLTDERMHK